MDNSEDILRKAVKSVQFPEMSSDFTAKVLEEINHLPKPKPIIVKPLINPIILWSGLAAAILITVILTINTKNIGFTNLNYQNIYPIFDFLKQITNNYLLTAYVSLILLWFLIDYRLINRGKAKLSLRKISLK